MKTFTNQKESPIKGQSIIIAILCLCFAYVFYHYCMASPTPSQKQLVPKYHTEIASQSNSIAVKPVAVTPSKPTVTVSNTRNLNRAATNTSKPSAIRLPDGAPKTVYVRGYYRKDGTYVRGHYRRAPLK